MAFEKTPFYVGGHYRDRERGYTVIEITDRNITVEYEDGSKQTLDEARVKIKARIHENIVAEFDRKHPAATPKYYEMLGFLSRHAKFEAEVPQQSLSNFTRNYENQSGQRLDKGQVGLFVLNDGDKWGAELRIYFPDNDHDLEFGPDVDVRSGWSDGTSRINNNRFWLRLISLGFRFGSEHDAAQIRNTIPADMQKHFDKGRTY